MFLKQLLDITSLNQHLQKTLIRAQVGCQLTTPTFTYLISVILWKDAENGGRQSHFPFYLRRSLKLSKVHGSYLKNMEVTQMICTDLSSPESMKF